MVIGSVCKMIGTSGLSAWKYIKNNKKAAGTVMMAVALVFTGIYVIYVLLMTSVESFGPVVHRMPSKLAFVYLGGDPEFQAGLIDDLKTCPGVRDAYFTQVIMATYRAVVGQLNYEVPLMDTDKIPVFLDHMDAELIDGRLPEGDGEMLVDSVIMRNMNLQTGGWFMEGDYGKTFRIVGVIESPYMVSAGTPMGFTNTGWYTVIEKDESLWDFTGLLESLGYEIKGNDTVIDGPAYEEFYEDSVVDVIDNVLDVIFLLVMIFLAVTVIIAYVSFMRSRVSEYCLYASIGYSAFSIYGMLMREMIIIFAAGSVIGTVMGLIGSAVFKEFLIVPMGLICRVFYPAQIVRILAVYILIIGILQIPALIGINSIKTIDAIED